MYYVSEFRRKEGLYGITDTEDGVTEYYSRNDILTYMQDLNIKGVGKGTIKVVRALTQVAGDMFNQFGEIVKQKIYGYTVETCYDLAKSASFVRKIKACQSEEEVHQVTFENIYPASVQEVVKSAAGYTNRLIYVDVSDPNVIVQALQNNVCLVLQHKTNGALTAFICTGSMSLMDRLYGKGFFDALYLTKNLYAVTTNIEKMRTTDSAPRTKNPDMLNVFSCSLRFRAEGRNKDGALKELSSPFYTVNIPRVLAMFILNDVGRIGDTIVPEFAYTARPEDYKFDFEMYKEVTECVKKDDNLFLDKERFTKYIPTESLSKVVDLTRAMQQFDDNFAYMHFIRKSGYSFKV